MKVEELQKVKQEMINFVGTFGDLLGRSERRHWCGMYLSGLLLDGERKSVQPISEKLLKKIQGLTFPAVSFSTCGRMHSRFQFNAIRHS